MLPYGICCLQSAPVAMVEPAQQQQAATESSAAEATEEEHETTVEESDSVPAQVCVYAACYFLSVIWS